MQNSARRTKVLGRIFKRFFHRNFDRNAVFQDNYWNKRLFSTDSNKDGEKKPSGFDLFNKTAKKKSPETNEDKPDKSEKESKDAKKTKKEKSKEEMDEEEMVSELFKKISQKQERDSKKQSKVKKQPSKEKKEQEEEEEEQEEEANDNKDNKDNKEKETKKTFGLTNVQLTGLILLSAFVFSIISSSTKGGVIGTNAKQWSDFVKDLETDSVNSIQVHHRFVVVFLKNGVSYTLGNGLGGEVFVAKYNELVKEIKTNHEIESPSVYFDPSQPVDQEALLSSVFTTLAFIAVFVFMFRQISSTMGGVGEMMGRFGVGSKKTSKLKSKSNVKFADVAGLDESKLEIVEFVEFLKNPGKFEKMGAKIPKGALLVGPPGTGKTMLAKAIAGEANVPFFSMAGSEFVEMVVGVGAQRVRQLFKEAKEDAPAIIFIDEIDAVGRQRASGKAFGRNDERENTLNQLLVEMDGFSENSGVIVLAATNRADILDRALLRPGRFDRKIDLGLPDVKGREEIFRVYLAKLTIEKSKEEYAKVLAALTPGFSGADISNVCNEAALQASRENATSINILHFEYAVERVIAGLEKRSKVLTPEEKIIVAHHEAGHAVAGWFLKYAHPLLKVSIVPRGSGALGYAQYLPNDKYITTKSELMDNMSLTLGGRVAEKLIFGHLSTGASDDLRRVTQMAYGMVTQYGMNSEIGNVCFDMKEGDFAVEKPYSQQTEELIDVEARKLIQEALDRTEQLLTKHLDGLKAIAQLLLKKEKIDAEDMVAVLGDRPESAFSDQELKNFLESKKQSARDASN